MIALKNFQKLFWICILTITFGIAFPACGDDDGNVDEVNSASIIGKWKLTEHEDWTRVDGVFTLVSDKLEDSEIVAFKFNYDNTGVITYDPNGPRDMEYIIDENQIIITEDSFSTILKIIRLNATTLFVEWHYNDNNICKMTFTRVN